MSPARAPAACRPPTAVDQKGGYSVLTYNPQGLCRGALVASLVAVLSGCAQSTGWINPAFDDLQPEVIRIAPVKNETLYPDLDRFSPTGPLQRGLLGAAEIDVPGVLAAGAAEALEELGYFVVEEAAPPAPDLAELQIRITGWRRGAPPGGRGLEGFFAADLIRADSGEVLYTDRCRMSVGDTFPHRGTLSPVEVERALRDAIRRCLAGLPPRTGEGR